MARKRQDEKDETAIDMVSSLGFSPIGDGTYTNVKDFLPTFIPQWDYLLGGGIPFGRLTEIYADNAVGKSTLLIHLNRVANALGTDVFWIDTEETSDGNRMESLGIDQNHTFIFKPQKNDTSGISIEKVGKVIENIINKKKDSAIEIDLLYFYSLIIDQIDNKLVKISNVAEKQGLPQRYLRSLLLCSKKLTLL